MCGMNIHSVSLQRTSRLLGIDIARSFAVIGMIMVNYAVVMAPLESTATTPLAFLEQFIQGKAAALFVVLAGVGASLGSKRARNGTASDRRAALVELRKRALFLYVVGWMFYFVWPADILHFYGIYLFVGSFFLFKPTKVLVWASGLFAVGGLIHLVSVDYFINWNLDTLDYEGIFELDGFLRSQLLNGFHPAIPWIAFYLAGIWLGRQDLHNLVARRRILGVSLAVFVGGLIIGWIGGEPTTLANPDPGAGFLLIPSILPPTPMYLIVGTSGAFAAIIACLGWGDRIALRDATRIHPLVATGQLALTLYIAHVIPGLAVIEIFTPLAGKTVDWAVVAAIIFFAASVPLSTMWRTRYERGPLETLMRRIA